ncbi:hypothetical protein N7470_008326 [Penicillium chermesinum]|nr:hypothetical protein N7470_008326 [Penicillium chermesinum]
MTTSTGALHLDECPVPIGGGRGNTIQGPNKVAAAGPIRRQKRLVSEEGKLSNDAIVDGVRSTSAKPSTLSAPPGRPTAVLAGPETFSKQDCQQFGSGKLTRAPGRGSISRDCAGYPLISSPGAQDVGRMQYDITANMYEAGQQRNALANP